MVTQVALVPGAAGLGAFWDPIRAELPSDWRQQTFDLPGVGPVPPLPEVSSFDTLVDHLASRIEAPGVLVGQSMGGYLAMELAVRHPRVVTHLVLIVAAAGVDMARHGATDWRPSHQGEHGNAAWVYGPTRDLRDALRRLSIPVQLVWATRDPISPLGVGEELASLIPGARLLTFDTDDHWAARGHAREVARAIEALARG